MLFSFQYGLNALQLRVTNYLPTAIILQVMFALSVVGGFISSYTHVHLVSK